MIFAESVRADRIQVDGRAGTVYPQVLSGDWTGDDGGTGVTYVQQQSCGFLGLDDCIRVDENATVCNGGAFVVAARLHMTDTNQIGVQVKCTDPSLTP